MDIKQAIADGIKDAFKGLSREAPQEKPEPTVVVGQTPPGERNAPHGGTGVTEEKPSGVTPEQAALLTRLASAGLTTVAAFEDLVGRAEDGDAFRKQAEEKLTAEAVRRFGQEEGAKIAASAAYANLPAVTKLSVAGQWGKEADEKFGVSESQGAKRQTAPGALAQGVNAEGSGQGDSAWARLSQAERTEGLRMGMDTPDKQERYARTLAGKEGK